jgi:hypothetical protein
VVEKNSNKRNDIGVLGQVLEEVPARNGGPFSDPGFFELGRCQFRDRRDIEQDKLQVGEAARGS